MTHRGWYSQPAGAALGVGLFGFLLAAALTVSRGWPSAPAIHDEFSYLLASDTFARGRLTNPPHQFWEHFESFHIIQQPTYASKYPPAPAFTLALGQRLTGQPVVGVWFAYGALCAALTWMLQGWVRPRWALWGGLFAAVWLAGVHADHGYWGDSFWGGATTATGGALLLGGLRRVEQRASALGSLAMGGGVGILALSRPFEGLLMSLVPLGVVVVWASRQLVRGNGATLIRGLVPAALMLVLTAGFMGWYNYRVTGSATTVPYAVYEDQYASSPLFIGASGPPPREYRHEMMREFYLEGLGVGSKPTSIKGWAKSVWLHSGVVRFFLFPFFALPLFLLAPWAIANRWTAIAAASCALVFAGLLVNPWLWQMHYAAPLFGGYLIILVGAARQLNALHIRGHRRGVGILRVIVVVTAYSACLSIALRLRARAEDKDKWQWQRQAMEQRLSASGAPDLVLIEYGPRHQPDFEWVYNGADIDQASVVWARSMGAERDARLLAYFANRSAWRLSITDDAGPFVLNPIPRSTVPGQAAHARGPVAFSGQVRRVGDPLASRIQ